jgi:hypothetical protein
MNKNINNELQSCDNEHRRIMYFLDLIQTAIDTNGGFYVGMPKELVEDRAFSDPDGIMSRLRHAHYQLAFRSGRHETLTFTDLIVFLYNFRAIKKQVEVHEKESRRRRMRGRQVHLDITTDEEQIMKPEVVKEMLRYLSGMG